MRALRLTSAAFALAALIPACGGKQKPAPEPVAPAPRPKPAPPPPPVCVKAGAEMSLIGMATAGEGGASFCVSDGADANQCFHVDLAAREYSKLAQPPKAQPLTLAEAEARVETTATEIKVSLGETQKIVKPRVPKGAENPIDARVNAAGTLALVFLGDAEAGKGIAEVWDVTKARKLSVIRYAKGDYKCGTGQVLGDLVYISSSVCAGPAAKGALYSARGKKLADVGGKDFGTYGTMAVQASETAWAFLEESGTRIALHDGKTGKLTKTLDVAKAWQPEAGATEAPAASDAEAPAADATPAKDGKKPAPADLKPPVPAEPAAPPPSGNPGESALVRGGPGSLVVITGSPSPGNVAVVTVDSGDVTLVHARPCAE
jgi:hypothetical protein